MYFVVSALNESFVIRAQVGTKITYFPFVVRQVCHQLNKSRQAIVGNLIFAALVCRT
jgi:hypothetical protein